MPVEQATIEAVAGLLITGDWVEAIADESYAGRLDALREIAAPDLEVEMIGPGGSFRQSFRGIDGVRDAWLDWLAPFESYYVEAEDLRLVDDRFVFLGHQVAVPNGGGGQVEGDAAAVFFFKDGVLERIEFHLDQASALRSAGLE
jgi:SnoaL-like protein